MSTTPARPDEPLSIAEFYKHMAPVLVPGVAVVAGLLVLGAPLVLVVIAAFAWSAASMYRFVWPWLLSEQQRRIAAPISSPDLDAVDAPAPAGLSTGDALLALVFFVAVIGGAIYYMTSGV